MDRTIVEHPLWSIAVVLLGVSLLAALITAAVMGPPWDIRRRHAEVPACVVPR
jgi:hypothetical protein